MSQASTVCDATTVGALVRPAQPAQRSTKTQREWQIVSERLFFLFFSFFFSSSSSFLFLFFFFSSTSSSFLAYQAFRQGQGSDQRGDGLSRCTAGPAAQPELLHHLQGDTWLPMRLHHNRSAGPQHPCRSLPQASATAHLRLDTWTALKEEKEEKRQKEREREREREREKEREAHKHNMITHDNTPWAPFRLNWSAPLIPSSHHLLFFLFFILWGLRTRRPSPEKKQAVGC